MQKSNILSVVFTQYSTGNIHSMFALFQLKSFLGQEKQEQDSPTDTIMRASQVSWRGGMADPTNQNDNCK